jgi:predicted DNA-binding transcriptional regulator AlpA
MARREVTGRKPGEDDEQPPAPTPHLALSIQQFCKAHSISEDFFYKLKRQGQAPRLMRVGSRTLISIESAAEWRREREAASTANTADMGA